MCCAALYCQLEQPLCLNLRLWMRLSRSRITSRSSCLAAELVSSAAAIAADSQKQRFLSSRLLGQTAVRKLGRAFFR